MSVYYSIKLHYHGQGFGSKKEGRKVIFSSLIVWSEHDLSKGWGGQEGLMHVITSVPWQGKMGSNE